MVRSLKGVQHVTELRKQARQMARQAGALLRIADNLVAESRAEAATGDPLPISAPITFEHEQLLGEMAERQLREHRRRRALFPPQVLGEIGWDLLLVLYRNRVHGRRAAVASLTVELETTLAQVEEAVRLAIEEGLAERTMHRGFIRLSDAGTARLREFFAEYGPESSEENPLVDCA